MESLGKEINGSCALLLRASPFFRRCCGQTRDPRHPLEATVPQLERDIPELMKKDGVPGLAIALIRGGNTTWLHGFGVKEVQTGQPVTEATVFGSGFTE